MLRKTVSVFDSRTDKLCLRWSQRGERSLCLKRFCVGIEVLDCCGWDCEAKATETWQNILLSWWLWVAFCLVLVFMWCCGFFVLFGLLYANRFKKILFCSGPTNRKIHKLLASSLSWSNSIHKDDCCGQIDRVFKRR